MNIITIICIFLYFGIGASLCLVRYKSENEVEKEKRNENKYKPIDLIFMLPYHLILWLPLVIATLIYRIVWR